MSSSTTSNAATSTAAAPSIKTIFDDGLAALGVDELNQLQTTIEPVLASLQSGDGSWSTLLGAGVSFQAAFMSNASLFQKIGVNDGAGLLSNVLLAGISTLKAKVASLGTSSGNGQS